MKAAVSNPAPRLIPAASIRKDGETQHRIAIDAAIVAEYSDLMREGVEFPPIRVWWDGNYVWLSDGFQRVEAAQRAALEQISAEVLHGSLEDARWDSYTANATHGMRRTAEESRRIVQIALEHPNAASISNVELAKHLHLSETTLRRWRKLLSSSRGEDAVRTVTRGETTYRLATKRIGKTLARGRTKSRGELRADLNAMKARGSPTAQRLLTIIGNWVLGSATYTECLEAIERVLGV